ncbi:Arrestin domain-containing protein 3 [Orchesella cincta]|uniref:Arrestin domain-containing protein 3 n=1 Tax=Orchesella cincta TaxID=48709 RepID=A0A1D2MF40_ORCCI|nr:Arrestin domain-containing protein 3 [Orchesella cincta]
MSVEILDVIPDKLEYWPGETITGKVILKVKNSSIQSQGIFLNFKGGATVEIMEQVRRMQSGNRRSSTLIEHYAYPNSENLLSITNFLAGDGRTSLTHREGDTTYPFSIQLPSHLVSSYYRISAPIHYRDSGTQCKGQVLYYLEVGMMMAGMAAHVSQKTIAIHAHLDLTTVPETTQAGEAEATKTFCNCWSCCFGCQSGPFILKVRTDKRGYLPGETIAFEVEVRNESGRIIREISAQFIEAATMVGQGKTECAIIPLGEMVVSNQEFRAEDENWRGELVVPMEGTVYPSKLGGGCGIISVEYFIKIVAHANGCGNQDLEVSSSVIIGTCRGGASRVPSAKIKSYLKCKFNRHSSTFIQYFLINK